MKDYNISRKLSRTSNFVLPVFGIQKNYSESKANSLRLMKQIVLEFRKQQS